MYEELVKRLHEQIALSPAESALQDVLLQAADAIEQLDMITDNLNYLYKTEATK